MRCPQNSEFWQRYVEDGNPEAARHLQHCAACRREIGHAAHLPEMLSHLPELASTEEVTARFRLLAQATTGQQFTCTDALSVLEAWREGDLDAAQSFLVEDHLLWCDACAEEFAQAELLVTALRAIPVLQPPAVIAERLAAARIPWWQRMLQPVQPAWGRLAPAAGLFAAAALLLACIFRAPLAPQVAAVPVPTVRVATIVPAVPLTPKFVAPKTESPVIAQLPVDNEPGNSLKEDKSNFPRVHFRDVKPPKNTKPKPSQPGPDTHEGDNSPSANYAYVIPVASNGRGGQVPDLDSAEKAPPVREFAYYSAHDSIMRKVREDDLAEKEAAQSIAPDSAKFAMARPAASKPDITPTPQDVVDLPDKAKPNAEINAMLHQLNKSRGNVAVSPPPVTRVASHGEYHADGSLLLLQTH